MEPDSGRGRSASNRPSRAAVEVQPATVDWHALEVDSVLERLGSSRSGLAAEESERRLLQFGPNRLSRIEAVSAWRLLLDQFKSLVVLLLLAAAVVALVLGDVLEAAAIALVLALNTTIGFTVELRARRAMDALLRFESPTARVVRNGRATAVASERLVPGDVVVLEEGDAVPADARVVEGSGLRVNEAPLTGESLPVDKDVQAVATEALLAERTSMLHSGTMVTAGRGTAVVTTTGRRTALGRIGELLEDVEDASTPLEVRLERLGRRLVGLTLVVAVAVIGFGVLRGAELGLMIETGLALAIAAVPEGLPAVATIALAVGLRRMAARRALVRRLPAVEALGSTTVICTDKTGTLTEGQMTAAEVWCAGRTLSVTGQGFGLEGEFLQDGRPLAATGEPWLRELLEACGLTQRASLGADLAPVGDPTDAALLVLALKGGVDLEALRAMAPMEGEVAFSSHRRSSASIHRRGGDRVIYLKGAVSTLLSNSLARLDAEGESRLDQAGIDDVLAAEEVMASQGLRVIGLARGRSEEQLTFLGMVGIVDPPARGVRETIAALRGAGIRTIMVTGDQSSTANAIARSLGVVGPGVGTLDGREFAALSRVDLIERMGNVGVLSRVSPEQKLEIVEALQGRGEVVAMIGDGVNDAPALKRADVGVAMGDRGTDVAKQAADIVLSDDRFATLGAAVEEGRVIFENIRKFVYYLFSCNLAEILVLLGGSLALATTPLLPLQILWLNLVTDTFPALSLAFEPPDEGLMERPPRDPDRAILSRPFLTSMLFFSSLITAVTLAAYVRGALAGSEERAITLAFMTLALAQLFHLGNARSRGPVIGPARMFSNRWAVGSVPLVLGLQILAVTWAPLMQILHTTSMTLQDWGVVVTLSLVPAVVGQILEIAQRARAS